jgi:hypothetical protein
LARGNPFPWISHDFFVGKFIPARGNPFWHGEIYFGAGKSILSRGNPFPWSLFDFGVGKLILLDPARFYRGAIHFFGL